MNDFNAFSYRMSLTQGQMSADPWDNKHHAIVKKAMQLYDRAYRKGQFARFFAWIRRRPFRLLNLTTVKQHCQICNQFDAGLQTVPLSHIRGSDNRSHDFDLEFHPTQKQTRMRWLGVAMACLTGESLPPIELIQIGDIYFVGDGHHRISVARTLGQLEIEAQVKTWQVQGAFPGGLTPFEAMPGNKLPAFN